MMRLTRSLRATPPKYVSLRYAPSFRLPQPSEVVGVATKRIPPDCVPAFVVPEVIDAAEEQALLALAAPWFARLPYNDGHMDSLIHHFKEFYRPYRELVGEAAGDVNRSCCDALDEATLTLARNALRRCRKLASEYLVNIPLDDRVHFLRLSGSGFIRAHVDDSRNSSGIVAGLCLSSARVMTLTHPKHPGERLELLLAPRAFYVLIGSARYEWEHSVDWETDDPEHLRRVRGELLAEGNPVVFDGKETPHRREERTAIIFRGVPPMQLLLSKMQKKHPAA
ncbi:alkylated DNA repair protein alkB like protein 7 [Trypanosoma conorhini]|uniref:Alkylated DNA repair protein alkB like protein 7 n=1 Tax=Trypanosoma conorhini TaxID=83891 RepID=A0A422NH77_9TRYP|nr:alkylated DNA repair protein alkB like protein 7 [Trypanosoma conorhini]RNF04804.1 alkylated DNA repair protein alkB like protein 7 [Trypanosoma conorhini]